MPAEVVSTVSGVGRSVSTRERVDPLDPDEATEAASFGGRVRAAALRALGAALRAAGFSAAFRAAGFAADFRAVFAAAFRAPFFAGAFRAPFLAAALRGDFAATFRAAFLVVDVRFA